MSFRSDVPVLFLISCFVFCATFSHVEGLCQSFDRMRENATLDYLILERDLWKNITASKTVDKESLYVLARDSHTKFLKSIGYGNIHISNKLYELPSSKHLQELVKLVQDLRNEKFDYAMDESLNNAAPAFEGILNGAKNLSAAIAQEIGRPEFWKDATNYIDFCKNVDLSKSVFPYSTPIEAPYQKIYEYFRDGSGALLRAYIFTQLAHMVKTINDKESGKNIQQPNESLVSREEFKERIRSIHQLASNALKGAPRDVWFCRKHDTSVCKSCSRFVAMMNFLQGFVDNEINLNPDGSCSNSCSDYTKTKQFGCANGTMCADPKGLAKEDTTCSGDVRDCIDIGTDGDVLVNYAEHPHSALFAALTGGPSATFRYNYIQFNDGKEKRTFGLDPKDVDGVNLTAPTWHAADGSKCGNCFCLCDTNVPSDRHFSLRDVVSTIHENKVVYAVGLDISGDVVHLRIREAKLVARGEVDDDQSSSITSDYKLKSGDDKSVDGVDYFTMTYENRAINLDDVVLPVGKVVTGVRFAHRNGHVLLEVRGTDVDFVEGRLKNLENSVWYSNADGGKHEYKLPNRLNPFEKHNNGKMYVPQNLKKDSYIRFVPSDLKEDASQMTVPVIESETNDDIKSSCPTALGGVGLAYVNDEGLTTAGAITPKLIVYESAIPTIDELLLK